MSKLLILGAGGHGRAVSDLASRSSRRLRSTYHTPSAAAAATAANVPIPNEVAMIATRPPLCAPNSSGNAYRNMVPYATPAVAAVVGPSQWNRSGYARNVIESVEVEIV